MCLEQSEDTVPVALYIRTLAGNPGIFLQVQLTALQRYARRRQLDAVRVFFDVQGRPEPVRGDAGRANR